MPVAAPAYVPPATLPTPIQQTVSLPTMTPAPVQRAVAPPAPLSVQPVLVPVRPAIAPTPTPVPSLPSTGGCEQIIALVNQVREESGLSSLVYHPQLGVAAQRYAEFIAAHDVLNHTADGRTLDKRAEAAGYTTWVALGENLAGGYTTFDEALTAWLASPTHRDNIMNPGFTETGVGCAWNTGSAYGSFFVQEFGTR